jgi:polyphosphate glucokinase
VRSPSDKPLSRMSRRNVRGLTQIDDHMAVAIPNNGPVVAPADTSAAVPPPVPASAGPNDAAICDQSSPQTVPQSILVIDIGGSKVKVLATNQIEPRKKASGSRLDPTQLVNIVKELANGWDYEAVSIGYPGLVGHNGPFSEPGNLGPGWVGFNFTAAFGKPVRIVNDAGMQALGSYEGGRMLFLGLGTGLGSALIAQNSLITLELGRIPHNGQTFGEVLGRCGLERLGKKAWRKTVAEIVPALMAAFVADYVVIGGGNAKEIKEIPPGARLGHNLTAFRGGFRLWHFETLPTLTAECGLPNFPSSETAKWRLI